MAAKTVRQLREDVTTRMLTLSGWRESRVLPESFGRDADSIAHKAFVVHPVATKDLRQYRGKPAEGTLVETDLEVRYSWRMAPKDMSNSYDDSLDGAQAVINLLMVYSATWPGNYKVQLLETSQAGTDTGEWVIGVVTFRVVHTLPLQ
jgi:hypothetical protein